jgi:hypothetical protein
MAYHYVYSRIILWYFWSIEITCYAGHSTFSGFISVILKLILSKKDKTRKQFVSPGQQLISGKVD